MMEKKVVSWTKEQLDVIESSGKNLLVSASAGSGKTTVMIEKIVRILIEKRIPISDFLVVTFTKASAQDMKKKLIDSLLKMPADEFLLEQISAVENSDISTLHVFCSRLIQTYFYELEIDPNFSVIDENESNLFKDRAILKVFESEEKVSSEDYFTILEIFKKKRDGEGLKNAVLELDKFLKSLIDGENWFKKTIETSHETDIESSECAQIINRSVCARISDLIDKSGEFEKKCLEFGEGLACQYFVDLQSMLGSVSFKNSYLINAKNLFEISVPTVPKFNENNDELKTEVSEFLKDAKKVLKELCDLMISSDAHELKIGMVTAKKHIRMLFDLTLKFEQVYSKLKRDAGVMDFNDLENFALKILENKAISEAVKQKYKFVFVDEYQDINEVQEEIISKVSSSSNRFMVGDIKQSIYAFRLCDPEIFKRTLKTYSANKNTSDVVKLNANFRSDKKILSFVDKVFSGVMTEKFGGTDYQKDAKFVPGENNLDAEKSMNLFLIDSPKIKAQKADWSGVYSVKDHVEEDEEDTSKIIAEANLVAGEISKLTDPRNENAYKRSEIAILVSARKNPKIDKFIEILESFGISVSSGEKVDIIREDYIQEILNFANLCINKNDDITLFKVLKSKLFNFSNDDLVEIRKLDLSAKFSECVFDKYTTLNDGLREKLNEFNADFEYFSKLSKLLPIKEFVKVLIDKHKLIDLNLASKDGTQTVSNLKQFQKSLPDCYTVEFVMNFSKYSQIIENDMFGDAVKLMTIHSSKGLDFKVVFLIDLNHAIKLSSTYGSFLMNKDIGVTLDYFDFETKTKQTTIPISAVRILEQRKIVEEQQRVLYVALTRAIEKLYVICSMDSKKIREKFPNRPKAFANWMEPIIFKEISGNHDEKINFEMFDISQLLRVSKSPKKQLILSKGGEGFEPFKYEFIDSVSIPLKTSVSKMMNMEFEDENDDYESAFVSNDVDNSSALRGTTYHKVFSKIDFYKKDFDVQVDEIVAELSDDEKKLIEKRVVLNCLNNEFFECITSNDKVLKEREFISKMPAKKLENHDEIILQGVIDLLIIKDGEIYLLDYKTGKITDEKQRKYSFQLDLYAKVLEKAYKIPVTKKVLAYVDEQKFIEI